MVRFILVLLGFFAVAAFFTRPGLGEAEAALKGQLMKALEREELGGGRGTAGNLALAACKLKPSGCYDLIRTGIDASFSDHLFYSRYSIVGFGKTASCVGAFTTFICPGGLKDN